MNQRRLIALAADGLACAGGVALLRPVRWNVDAAAVHGRADRIGLEHGVYIGYGAPETVFVAPFTSRDALIPNGVATGVELDAVPVALDGIEQGLAVYPHGFVSGRCKAIFICGRLDARRRGRRRNLRPRMDHSRGDTPCRRCRDPRSRPTRDPPRTQFPHLERNARPSWPMARADAPWMVRGARQRGSAGSAQPGAADFDRGFLSPYGATTAENDFNVYAEMAFTQPARVAALADAQHVIARKLALLMDAYTSIDSRLSDVFRELGISRFAGAA